MGNGGRGLAVAGDAGGKQTEEDPDTKLGRDSLPTWKRVKREMYPRRATVMAGNAAKCEVPVFWGTQHGNNRRLTEAECQLGGTPMRVLASNGTARYLGLHFVPGSELRTMALGNCSR